ncbi:MAG TPA: RNA methyltransferase [Candidatus Avamphibacillus sp.]|nr:RNA methyltransferase [Candidatus Avamphibacillus sp.]
MNKLITSTQNEQVKKWRKLHKRKGREISGQFMVEGFHLVEEACQSDWEVIDIILQENMQLPSFCKKHPHTYVSEKVFAHISQTKSPQGIAAIVKMKQTDFKWSSKVLLVDAIQDPGNLGTIIRTADAAGFHSIILGNGTVDVYNDKVIRSTQGSLFHVTITQGDLKNIIPHLQLDGFTVWASDLENAKIYNQVERQEKTALIVGNEGSGIDNTLLKKANMIVKIPIHGQAESLNVSIAAGILMYYINSYPLK